MKRTLWRFILPVIVCFILPACSKNDSKGSNGKQATIVLSENKVKKGQLLIANASTGITGDVKWSVNTAYAHVTTSNSQATVQFAQGGFYHITATYNSGHDSASSSVVVSDSVYTPVPPPAFDTLSLAGEQVTLTPMLDSIGNLILVVQSAKSYDCFPTFVWSMDLGAPGAQHINIDLIEIISGSVTGNCNGTKNPANSMLFTALPGVTWSNGTYPISVKMNNITYTGSFTISATGYSFDWNYTSGVLINPKQISR